MKYTFLILLACTGCFAPVHAPTVAYYTHSKSVAEHLESRCATDLALADLLAEYISLVDSSNMSPEDKTLRHAAVNALPLFDAGKIEQLRIEMAAMKLYEEQATREKSKKD